MLDIADQIERESDVETVRSDAMEAWQWVREHGGLDRIQTMVATLGDTLNWIRERIGLDKDEVVDYDELLDALDRRLMPEGVEWPRYDTGEPVRIDGTIADELGRAHEVTSVEVFDDAAALHWSPSEPEEFVWLVHGERARRPAVPAGDGEPLEAGQTVWDEHGDELQVLSIEDDHERHVMCHYEGIDGVKATGWWLPHELTHTKPEAPDSAERIADDIRRMAEEWCSHPTLMEASEMAANAVGEATMGVALINLSKRCKALAERERGE